MYKYSNYIDKIFLYKQKAGVGTQLYGKELHLNDSKYIDTMKLNNTNLFMDSISELYLMKLDTNHLMWRGYNNINCVDLMTAPGSNLDKFRFEPTWYGPPEVTIIYCCRNNLKILMETYPDLKTTEENYNLRETLNKYEHIMSINNASCIAYTIKDPCYLIDINNIDNLKMLEIKFNDNWSMDVFKKLLKLDRITFRQMKRIFLISNQKIGRAHV